MRKWLADLLFGWAQKLDPNRPTVQRSNGGWRIRLHGVPIADITPGTIRDTIGGK